MDAGNDDEGNPGDRKPSRAHLFQKGVCPNPMGRGYKKGPEPGEQFVKIYSQTVIGVDGKHRTRMEMLVDSLMGGALGGDLNAIEGLMNMHIMWANGGEFKGDGTKRVVRSSGRIAKVLELEERMARRARRRRR